MGPGKSVSYYIRQVLSDIFIVIFGLVGHGIVIVLTGMIDLQFLFIKPESIIRVEPHTLGQADPEEKHVNYFHPRVCSELLAFQRVVTIYHPGPSLVLPF